MLNNREKRPFVGRAAVDWRVDDPTRETARRDKLVSAWLPLGWSNDFGGLTIGLRNRTNYLGRYDRSLQLTSVATDAGATDRFASTAAGPTDPPFHAAHRDERGRMVRGGTRGRRALGRPRAAGASGLRRRSPTPASTPLDGDDEPRLPRPPAVEDAGTIEAGPGSPPPSSADGASYGLASAPAGGGVLQAGARVTGPRAATTSRALAASRARRAYGRLSRSARPSACGCSAAPTPAARSPCRSAAFPCRRRPLRDVHESPVAQRGRAVSCVRTSIITRPATAICGASGATWAAAGRFTANLELARSVWRRDRGILRDVALTGFADGGLVDTLAVPPRRPAAGTPVV